MRNAEPNNVYIQLSDFATSNLVAVWPVSEIERTAKNILTRLPADDSIGRNNTLKAEQRAHRLAAESIRDGLQSGGFYTLTAVEQNVQRANQRFRLAGDPDHLSELIAAAREANERSATRFLGEMTNTTSAMKEDQAEARALEILTQFSVALDRSSIDALPKTLLSRVEGAVEIAKTSRYSDLNPK